MIQLAYASLRCPPLSLDWEPILAESRVRNRARGITGMLLHERGHILQILEGPPGCVRALFDLIKADHRHSGVNEILNREIVRRDFDDAMGFQDLQTVGRHHVDELSEFFQEYFDMSLLAPSAAVKLLNICKIPRVIEAPSFFSDCG